MLDPRPLPIRFPEDIEHLDGAARGELRVPACQSCGQQFWPPGPVCPRDFSADITWVTSPGTGNVHSWVQFHKRYFDGDEVPYVIAQVRLTEGPQLTTSWTGESPPRIGDPAIVSFREIKPGVVLPEFGPRQTL